MSASALLFGAISIVRYLLHGVGVAGWTSVIVSVYFIGGLILANLGVLGLYIGKIFNEAKERPLYLVKDLVNFETEKIGVKVSRILSLIVASRNVRRSGSLQQNRTCNELLCRSIF